jgi:hypothetical protein
MPKTGDPACLGTPVERRGSMIDFLRLLVVCRVLTAVSSGRSLEMRIPSQETYDLNSNGIPRFVQADYIELAKIGQISRFRSGVGHEYSDAIEFCRSMQRISKEARDGDPLTCNGGKFASPGNLPNWVTLRSS